MKDVLSYFGINYRSREDEYMIDCASDDSDEVHESGDSITGETHDYMTKYLTIIVFFSGRG